MVSWVVIGLVLLVCLTIYKGAIIVPQQMRYVVERLGQYQATLDAGFHVLIPYIDSVRYRHSIKEQVLDIPEQICITSDNVQVGVDGIVYVRVIDARAASYGIDDYMFGIVQLAQTTLRSEIGKIELDKTFEARANINANVVAEVDKAAEAWGVKVLRYEIKNITPPREVITAMEKQMKAEREKRAAILASEGHRDSAINNAEGEKQRQIKESEASMMSQINTAKGEAEAILEVARATAEGLRLVGEALHTDGGKLAMELRIAEQYLPEFGRIAQKSSTVVLPANLTDLGGVIAMARGIFKPQNGASKAEDLNGDGPKIVRGQLEQTN
ncbi:MAG: SPFH domain-containing protein [Pseudomonadota bacterium]|jgi:regulator of protease activity HflC (stomatin/prohibitin superfamily)